MTKTVGALYDSRAEAELARARLIAEVRAKAPRIIAKDTAGALDGLNISRAAADSYRTGLRRGGHLLIAEVPSDAPAKRIIELLEQSVGTAAEEHADPTWGDAELGVRVELPDDSKPKAPQEAVSEAPAEPQIEELIGAPQPPSAEPMAAAEPMSVPPPVEGASIAPTEEEVRIGKRKVVGCGARVRSFTREAPAEEQVSLRYEHLEVENRPCERKLSDSELEAGGLFKERVFEIAEMREEPVVTKSAVVREEVIVRKRVRERTETIRDTVRHTEVEVEDVPESRGEAPTFFAEG